MKFGFIFLLFAVCFQNAHFNKLNNGSSQNNKKFGGLGKGVDYSNNEIDHDYTGKLDKNDFVKNGHLINPDSVKKFKVHLSKNYKKPKAVNSIQKDQRIVGGTNANPGQFPYQVAMRCEGDLKCGAILLTPRTVVTAAHCCFPITMGMCVDPQLQVGTSKNDASLGQIRKLSSFLMHPDYVFETFESDVCLMFVDEPFQLDGHYVAPLPLGNFNSCRIGTSCVISGFGMTKFNGTMARRLKFAMVPIIEAENCEIFQEFKRRVMTCAGYMSGNIDACQADSGGPMMCNGHLCGIVSFGYKCAEAEFPGVYASVPVFRNWIKAHAVY